MISPESFYEMNLKGKTPTEIMTVIRSLKREIGRLKNIMEHPDYPQRKSMIFPSESTRISCSQYYLACAKQALVEAGGEYTPSAIEKKAMEFENSIPFISKIEFWIGGFFSGYENRTYIINGNDLQITKESSPAPGMYSLGEGKHKKLTKKNFLKGLEEIHIGEWSKRYDCSKFGQFVMDGTQWGLKFYYSNGHKPVEIHGDNAYPYNFKQLLELFEIKK